MPRPTFAAVLLVLPALALAACHPRARAVDERPTSPSREVTAEEIAQSGALTAWDAVRLLSGYMRFEEDNDRQPARVSARGRSSIVLRSEPAFVLDGVRLVDYKVLKTIAAGHLQRIVLLTGPDATTRYGTNSGHGVVLITTRDGG